jgi:phosphatidylglycerol:prolipoprotein diacylglycerol transferase
MLGILAVVIFSLIRRRRLNLAADDLIHIVLYCLIGAIVGAKLLYLITMIPSIVRNFSVIMAHPEILRDLLLGGYVFFGGLLGAIFMMWLYCHLYHVDFDGPAALFAGAVPLFHMIARIGCFLAGCCYGIEADWGVVYSESIGAPNGVALIPVQLFESAANLLIFLAVLIYQRKRLKGSLTLYLVSYSVCRFLLEFLRGDEIRGHVFGLSTSQWIAAAIILICTIRLIRQKTKKISQV